MDRDGDAKTPENITKKGEAAKKKAELVAKKAIIEAKRIEIEEGLVSGALKHSKPKSGVHRSDVFQNGINLIYTSDDVEVKYWFFCTICKKVIDADVGKGNNKLRRHLDNHPKTIAQVVLSVPKDSLIDAVSNLLNVALRLNTSLSKEALSAAIGNVWIESKFVESAKMEMMKNSKKPTIQLSSEKIDQPLTEQASALTSTPPQSPSEVNENENENDAESVEMRSENVTVENSGSGCETVVICRKRIKAMPAIVEVEKKKKKVTESTTDSSSVATDNSTQKENEDNSVEPTIATIPMKNRRRKLPDTVVDVPLKKARNETSTIAPKKRNLRSNSAA